MELVYPTGKGRDCMSLYIMNRIGTEVLAASQSTPFYQSFPFMIVLTIVLVAVAVVVTAVVVKKGAKSAPVSSAPVTVKPQKAQKEPEFMAQQKQNKIQMLAEQFKHDPAKLALLSTISKDLKLSPSTVRRALKDLKKECLLETEQRYRTKGGKSSLLYKMQSK